MGKHKKRNTTIQKIDRYLLNIVILVHGRFDLLAKCLQAIPEAAKNVPHNIILVDNASPDKAEADNFYGSLPMENIVISKNKENLGFPKGCNIGFRRGYAPLVMFLNSDVILDPGSLEIMVKDLDDPKVGVVGMKLVFPQDAEGLPQDEHHRPAGKLQHIGLMTNIRGEFIHIFIGWDAEHPKVNAMHDVYAVTGAAMMTRRALFAKAGLFLEDYGKGCLTGDTYIYTENGLFRLEDLMGKEINSPCEIGVPTKLRTGLATIAHRNGAEKTIKLSLQQGFSISGTPNHKFICMNTEGTFDWKTLKEIREGDYVALRRGMNMFGKNNLPKDNAYLIGLYISEGSYDYPKDHIYSGRISITNTDEEIKQFLSSRGFKADKSSGMHFRKGDKQLVKSFVDMGFNLFIKSPEKIIPQFLLSADKETTIALLQGMFDGDGSAVKDGRITYTTSSFILAQQVQFILLNFGIVSGIHEREGFSFGKFHRGYIVTIRNDADKFMNEIGFRIVRKQTNFPTKIHRGMNIPYQRKHLKTLYKLELYENREYKEFGFNTNNKSGHVRDQTIKKLLGMREKFSNNLIYQYLYSLVYGDYSNFVWLKVKSKEDGDYVDTFDLHVPIDNSYIANGFISHNTYDDVDYCLKLREMGYNIIVNPKARGIHYTGATAEKYKEGFPLDFNHLIFLQRWGGKLAWSEWAVL